MHCKLLLLLRIMILSDQIEYLVRDNILVARTEDDKSRIMYEVPRIPGSLASSIHSIGA